MRGCARERTLVALYYGEGTARQQAHVAVCPRCQTRYQRLVADLDILRLTLRPAPLPEGIQGRTPLVRMRWPQAALAAAVICLMLWGSARWWNVSVPGARPGVWEAELSQFLSSYVAPAVFAAGDTPVTVTSDAQTMSFYVQAALAETWGCTGQEALFHAECGE
jgi:hypothetical protein